MQQTIILEPVQLAQIPGKIGPVHSSTRFIALLQLLWFRYLTFFILVTIHQLMFSKTLAYLHLPIKIVNYCETAIYCLMIVICVKVFDSSWEQLASLCLNTALVRWEQIVWHRLQNILTYAKLFSCAAKH